MNGEMTSSPVMSVIEQGLADRAFSGAAWWIGTADHVLDRGVAGAISFDGDPVTAESRWDLASVTKPIVATAAMILVERGRLLLTDTVGAYLSECGDAVKNTTILDLLTHTSGLPGRYPLYRWCTTREDMIREVLNLPTIVPPGYAVIYSSQGYIILGMVLEAVCNSTLDRVVQDLVFGPLGMSTTSYGLPAHEAGLAVTTEHDPWRGRLVQGEVHDENAVVFGRPAGHAGMFATLSDVATYAQMLCGRGEHDGHQVLSTGTFNAMTRPRTDGLNARRSIGFAMPDIAVTMSGDLVSSDTFGHTGFTGTSFWVDPSIGRFCVLLTNRVHAGRDATKIRRIRSAISNIAVSIQT